MQGKGANVVLGPSVNVHRGAANGRNFEYLSGEDRPVSMNGVPTCSKDSNIHCDAIGLWHKYSGAKSSIGLVMSNQ